MSTVAGSPPCSLKNSATPLAVVCELGFVGKREPDYSDARTCRMDLSNGVQAALPPPSTEVEPGL